MGKVFVEITAKHDLRGNTIPLSLRCADGRVFEIDRVLDVRMAASLKGGGQGIRYTCRIRERQFYLFNDEALWFVET